jgi:rhodanese-related sulfurtransferase
VPQGGGRCGWLDAFGFWGGGLPAPRNAPRCRASSAFSGSQKPVARIRVLVVVSPNPELKHNMPFTVLVAVLACSTPAVSADPPAAADATSPAPAASVRGIDVAALHADLARGAVPLLVDVRTPEEFAAGHVPGAKNVPLDQLEGRLAELGAPGAELHVICQSGRRSANASATLVTKGYVPVDVLGGTAAWRAAGYAVE